MSLPIIGKEVPEANGNERGKIHASFFRNGRFFHINCIHQVASIKYWDMDIFQMYKAGFVRVGVWTNEVVISGENVSHEKVGYILMLLYLSGLINKKHPVRFETTPQLSDGYCYDYMEGGD